MGGWLTPRPGRFTPGKETLYPSYRRLGGPQGRSGRVRNISPSPGFDPWTVQPVVSHCTDWAIADHTLWICLAYTFWITGRHRAPATNKYSIYYFFLSVDDWKIFCGFWCFHGRDFLSGTQCIVTGWWVFGVSNENIAFVFKGLEVQEESSWRWRHCVPSERRELIPQWRGFMSQKAGIPENFYRNEEYA